ncbi:Calx-beta domain-containing protein [Thalassotalea piscium]
MASTTPEQQGKSIKLPPAKAYSALDNHIIKIGVFYTSDLLDEFTIEEINRYVQEQVNAANVVMENSGLAIRRELGYLGVHPIKNDPSQRIEDFLSRIRGNEGEENRNLALQFGLDYVTVLRPMNDNRFCGWAYYGDPYAILQMGGRCTSNTLAAHEWGHNDGADHDMAHTSAQPIRAYGHGYFCGGEGTIMSSPSGNKWNTRHNFYSSPAISVNGEACGEEDTANVVRMLNELKDNPFHMGNRQGDPEQLAYVRFSPQQSLLVKESDEVLVITLELVNAEGELITLGQNATIELYTSEDSALANTNNTIKDYQGFAQHVVFKPGESKVTINLTIESDNINEADEAFSLALRNGDIVSALDPEIEVTITENTVIEPSYVSFNQTERLVLQSGQTDSIILTRTGNLDVEFTASLAMSTEAVLLSETQVVFAAGQNTATVAITAKQDAKGETTTIELTNDKSQLGENSRIEVYILADEIISFNEDSPLDATAGDKLTLTLTRTGELLTAIDVEVILSDSWMTMANNSSAVIHFTAEQSSQSFSLDIASDSYGQSGTVSLNLPALNQGDTMERTINVADKIVTPTEPTEPPKPTKTSSSGGSVNLFLLLSLALLFISKKLKIERE